MLLTEYDDIGTEYWCPADWTPNEEQKGEANYLYEVNAIKTEEPEEPEEEVNVWAECNT